MLHNSSTLSPYTRLHRLYIYQHNHLDLEKRIGHFDARRELLDLVVEHRAGNDPHFVELVRVVLGDTEWRAGTDNNLQRPAV
ncbi:MAG: hypothetical protein GY847_19575 [Proteobacteria bacterium]|nr:hypothetical protein [Pseudomonadota bacterium]